MRQRRTAVGASRRQHLDLLNSLSVTDPHELSLAVFLPLGLFRPDNVPARHQIGFGRAAETVELMRSQRGLELVERFDV
jgi:hypothetical protein